MTYKDSASLGWGILGAAHIADDAFLPALNASRFARPVAIASRSPERARELADRHGVPRVHENYAAILDDPGVDVVYVGLVNSLHKEWTCRALSAGKHVLCEKPLALDVAQAIDMADSARDAGRLLMEGLMYRFHPPVREFVKDLEAIGSSVLQVDAKFSYPLDPGDDFRMHRQLGGGSLLDLGVYAVDLVRWIVGSDPVDVTGVVAGEEVDESAVGCMRFASGQLASVWTSFRAPELQRVEVVTDRSTYALERPFTPWRASGAPFADGLSSGGPYTFMVDSFVEAVIGGLPAPIPPVDSIANLQVLGAIAGSRATSPTAGGSAIGGSR